MKLSERLSNPKNNFDFIRFTAASLVILSHSYPLTGNNALEHYSRWTNGQDSLGGLSVSIFFIISGFLISKSWISNPNIVSFFLKRILRIMPGLIAAILFAVFFIGPLCTSLNLKEYFLHPQTFDYLLKNSLLYPIRFNLPGVFTNNIYPNSVNGSLWSLPLEFTMYCFTCFFGVLGLFKKRFGVFLIIAALFFLEWKYTSKLEYNNKIIFEMLAGFLVKFGISFFTGILLYLYKDKIPLSKYLLAGTLILFVLSFKTPYYFVASKLLLPYIVIGLAFLDIPYLSNFGKYGDFSYGMYVYAFPIQQTWMYFSKNSLTPISMFLVSFFSTLAIAILSWHFIESPLLKLKPKSKRQEEIASLPKDDSKIPELAH